MGSPIEINDTLKLRRGCGFPEKVEEGPLYNFSIEGRRIYNMSPSRVFLVEEIDGKWNYVGHALILKQWIDTATDQTMGEFKISRLYPRDYALMMNDFEAPSGKGYLEAPERIPAIAS